MYMQILRIRQDEEVPRGPGGVDWRPQFNGVECERRFFNLLQVGTTSGVNAGSFARSPAYRVIGATTYDVICRAR